MDEGVEKKVISDRIAQLRAEITQHEQELSQVQRRANELTTMMVSMNGGIIELQKLLVKTNPPNGETP